MDNIKSNLKGVVGSSAYGIPLIHLENEYYNITHSRLNYHSLGYSSIRNFLESIPDVVKIVEKDGQSVVTMVISRDDPKCLKDLSTLVNSTKKSKNKGVRSGSRNGLQNCNRNNSPLETFKISISNEHFRYAPSSSSVMGFSSRTAVRDGNSMLSERMNKENVSRPPLNTDMKSPAVGEVTDSGCWFLKPVIHFEPFDRDVRVLGIQSGHAVVIGSEETLPTALFKSKNVTTFFPGDIYLWQPPFSDQQRRSTFVDFNTAFPVTIIKRVCCKKVQARILGLVALLELSICDLFEMPTCAQDLLKLVRNIQSRQLTIVSVALIPLTTDIWDSSAYTGVYKVLLSIDEGGFILERSNKRGEFLNLRLLGYLQDHMVLNYNAEEKRAFLGHLKNCLERSISAVLPTFERLLSDKDVVHQESHPLRLIYNISSCADKMLIGSKTELNRSQINSKLHTLGQEGRTLHRLKYWENKVSFYSVDDQSADITVGDELPLVGIYIVNGKFSRSLVSKNDPLRLRAALLAQMPSIMDIVFRLGLHETSPP